MTTGWPAGLLQDDCRKLSKWFASRPDARYQLRRIFMTQQPEALRLADELDAYHTRSCHKEAAEELRRLHEENQKLTNRQEWWQEQHDVTVEALLQAQARITTLEAALRQAVEALEHPGNIWHMNCPKDAAITAAKQALEGRGA